MTLKMVEMVEMIDKIHSNDIDYKLYNCKALPPYPLGTHSKWFVCAIWLYLINAHYVCACVCLFIVIRHSDQLYKAQKIILKSLILRVRTSLKNTAQPLLQMSQKQIHWFLVYSGLFFFHSQVDFVSRDAYIHVGRARHKKYPPVLSVIKLAAELSAQIQYRQSLFVMSTE